ncbi:unnamed protein product [Meganyctiphanes norvegica]|uniref:Endonuclease/exonuclease/phosphatase domain-containing protein n=1 Tax=Meganyctiphanes norvegica TaxID=48144 RepID=A0AAV2QA07_MEGNR
MSRKVKCPICKKSFVKLNMHYAKSNCGLQSQNNDEDSDKNYIDSSQEISQTRVKSEDIFDLTCIYTNAQSLNNKFDEFKARVNIMKPHIIGISETHGKRDSLFSLEDYNYKLYNKDRRHGSNGGGGVLIYIHESISSCPIADSEEISNHRFTEHVWCLINLKNNEKCLIGCIYRRPSHTEANNELLLDLLYKANNYKVQDILIMGDFNWCYYSMRSTNIF